jgi:nucleoside-diphosphate-sugar epimerase
MPLDEFEKLYPERVSRRHTLYHQLLSNEKARNILGFRPQFDVCETLRDNLKFLVDTGKLRIRKPGKRP